MSDIKGIVIPADIYNKDGDMLGIEFNTRSGVFVIFAEWDERDEQTSENREAFRSWAYRMIEQLGHTVLK